MAKSIKKSSKKSATQKYQIGDKIPFMMFGPENTVIYTYCVDIRTNDDGEIEYGLNEDNQNIKGDVFYFTEEDLILE